ncbi:unnamed protein product [Rotaria sordida]|uniref:Pentapeptide repeat-containing protein n=2 Tax=Rotaria sordida TaxID=392033 RepID=A0A815TLE7_9BILA|nr:unnamed protein product [Rotaria sordida]
MLRRRSITINRTIKQNYHNAKIKSESNYHAWIKLILSALIPLMIAIFTIVTTILQQKLSTQQREQEKQDSLLLRQQTERQEDNLQKENIFATYLDDVSKLLLLENQTNSLIHIRMKTLSALRQLDPTRRKYLFLFLYESGLIYRYPEQPYVSLLKLIDADFNGIYFERTIETKCSLIHLYLYGVYLSNSSFIHCYIDYSNFSSATMYKTLFLNTLVMRTSFKFTFLDQANFSNTKISDTTFKGASLIECDFTGARWKENGVDFINANLSGAMISDEQLRNSTLYNCILPNGTWGPIRTNNLVVNGDAEKNVSFNLVFCIC